MVLSEEQKERDLWYEFDNYYEWNSRQEDPERHTAIFDMTRWSDQQDFGSLTNKWLREYLGTGTGSGVVNNMNKLTPYYIEVFERYFGKDYDAQTDVIDSFQWNAFVDYGLGTLYDPREPRSTEDRKYYVHVMDIGTYGYMRWHRFNWIASILYPQEGKTPSSADRWLYLDRLVGITGELHSRSKPRQSGIDGSEPDNPPNGDNMTKVEIHKVSESWLSLGFEEIEKRLAQLS